MFVLAAERAEEVELVAELVLDDTLLARDDESVLVGTKSAIIIVWALRTSGAGASKVLLSSVEHAVPEPQQAHDLLVELYARRSR